MLDAWVAAGGLAPLRQWLADFAASFDDEACQVLLHLLATLPVLHPDRIKESGLGKLVGKLRKDYGPATVTAKAAASGEGAEGGNGDGGASEESAAATAAAVTRAMATRVAVTWRLLLRGISDSGAKALGAPPDAATAAAGSAAAAGKRLVPGAGGGPSSSSSDPRAAKRPRATADVMGDALGGGGGSGKSRANMAPRDRAAEMRKLREERIAQRRALKKGEALTHVMASGNSSASASMAPLSQLPSSSLLPGPKKLSAEQLAARQAHVSKERAERQANLLERSRAAAAAAASSNAPSTTSSTFDEPTTTTRLYGARDSSAVPDAFQPISSLDQDLDHDGYEAGGSGDFYGDQSEGNSSSAFGGGSGGSGGSGGARKSAGKKLRWLDEEGGELEAVREFVTEKGGREGDGEEGGSGGGGSLAEKRRDEANREKRQMEEARAALEAEKAEERAAAWAAVEAMASACWPKRQEKSEMKKSGEEGEGSAEGAGEDAEEEEEEVGYRSPAALGGGLAVDRDGDGLDSMEVN